LPVTLRDGWLAVSLYNSFNATKAAGLGKYIKVAGSVVTSANIAAEYAKMYSAIPVVQRDDTVNPFSMHHYLTKHLLRLLTTQLEQQVTKLLR
jgi:hypothetical protein